MKQTQEQRVLERLKTKWAKIDVEARLKENKDCAQCGVTFFRKREWMPYKWAHKKFCSRRCVWDKRKGVNKTVFSCAVCEKNFEEYSCNRKYGTIHCSAKCMGTSLSRRLKGKPMTWADKIVAKRRANGSYKFSPEWCRNISLGHRKLDVRGERNPNWRGGTSDERQRLRKTVAYSEWRTAVFHRDDFTCQACGQRGGKLQADHELPWSQYPDLRFEVLNGRTLCVQCHIKTDTWGNNVHKVYA